MFHSSDIRTGQLAVIWIASTVATKKLSKKQVIGINIEKACNYLGDTVEMPLPMSSNLMCGIARIHKSQTEILYSDTNHLLLNFKKTISSIQSKEQKVIKDARSEQITFSANDLKLLTELDEQPLLFHFNFESQDRSLLESQFSGTQAYSQSFGSPFTNLGDGSPFSIQMGIGITENSSMVLQESPLRLLESLGQEEMLPENQDFFADIDVKEPVSFGLDDVDMGMPDDVAVGVNKKRVRTAAFELEDGVEQPTSNTKKQGRKRVLVDSSTMLSDLEMRNMRANSESLNYYHPFVPVRTRCPKSLKLFSECPPSYLGTEIKALWKNMYDDISMTEQLRAIELPFAQEEIEFQNQEQESEVGRSEVGNMPWHGVDSEPGGSARSSSVTKRKRQSLKSSSSVLGGFDDMGFDFSVSNQSASAEDRVSKNEFTLGSLEFEDTGLQPDMLQEVSAFLRFVKDVMLQAETNYVYLMDILQEQRKKSTATRAFYNMLVLANSGAIKVKQERSFKDIEISL